MISKRSLPKLGLSWAVAGLGFVIGLLGLSTFGMAWPPTADGSSGWFMRWFDIAGAATAGLIFAAGSMMAPRNRRRAGLIFLIGMPIAAFCLAYPSSGFLVWRDSGGWFETPFPWTAVGLTLLFYFPFLTSLTVMRYVKSRKLSACSFLASICFAGAIFGISRWTTVLLPRLVLWSAPFWLFGSFWLASEKWNWPRLLSPTQWPLRKRIAAVVVGCLFLLCADVAMTLFRSAMQSSLFGGDCRGRALFAAPIFPDQEVFTARIVHVGRSLGSRLRLQGSYTNIVDVRLKDVPHPEVGDWAIARVEENFWGTPLWPSHLVLLTNNIFWEGETYLVDGRRPQGLLTRMLPVVEIGTCTRTRPVEDAVLDLRVLREKPNRNTAQLMGYVYRPERFEGGFHPPKVPTPYVDAQISITSSSGTTMARTDSQGIYRIDGLQPEDYSVQLLLPATQTAGCFNEKNSPYKVHLTKGGLIERNFDVFWNGRIKGRVEDQFGKPAHVSVLLQSADASQLSGCVNFYVFTGPDGSYQFDKVPPGQYTLLVNNYGPADEWPFDSQYYISGSRRSDAAVLHVGEGQEIEDVDIAVQRLQERSIHVSVKGPSGGSSQNTQICTNYESVDHVIGCVNSRQTDEHGFATVYLYGNSRVRIWAEGTVANKEEMDTIYSQTIEEEASKVPEKLDLVLSSANK